MYSIVLVLLSKCKVVVVESQMCKFNKQKIYCGYMKKSRKRNTQT